MTNPEIDLSLSPLAIRRAIASLPPFHPPPVALDAAPGESLVQMNLNEASGTPSPRVIEAVQAALSCAGRYPDPRCRGVARAVAARFRVPTERIVVANGSDELITLVSTAFLEPGVEVVVPVPSFPRYQLAGRIAGADVVAVPLRADGRADVDRLLAAVDTHTRVVWCATPNNPTGGWIDEADARRVVAGVPSHTLLAIDEAYFEFGQAAGAPDLLALLAARHGPWVVLRTLSKAFALAGLRVGYALASSSELAEALNRLRNVFSVNVLAQAAAVAALGDLDHMRRLVAECVDERERLRLALQGIGLDVLPSAANFLAVATPLDAPAAAAAVRRAGILVTPIASADFPRFVRVTVGTREQNDRFVEAMGAVVASTA
jgi:histidinol-phosphate aminotransferase